MPSARTMKVKFTSNHIAKAPIKQLFQELSILVMTYPDAKSLDIKIKDTVKKSGYTPEEYEAAIRKTYR